LFSEVKNFLFSEVVVVVEVDPEHYRAPLSI